MFRLQKSQNETSDFSEWLSDSQFKSLSDFHNLRENTFRRNLTEVGVRVLVKPQAEVGVQMKIQSRYRIQTLKIQIKIRAGVKVRIWLGVEFGV